MNKKDCRKLKIEAQQEIRYLAVKLYNKGIKQKEIAQTLEISLSAIKLFIKIYKDKGFNGLT